jgi:hypothetical protein
MGRFDILTNLEEPKTKVPEPTPPKPSQKPRNGGDFKMPTNPQNHKTTSDSPTTSLVEKPEKYTTHLEPSLIKKLKMYALENDLKDYQVIKNALVDYFDKTK